MLISKYDGVVPRVEAEAILSHALKCSRTDLYVSDRELDRETEELCGSLVERRLAGEPLQHIIGSTEFMGMEFAVNKDVFIPRPETELLVEEILRYTSCIAYYAKHALRILDICTGCGNIAISLARSIPRAEIIATDISPVALDVARRNAIIHRADKQIVFCEGDLFEALALDKKYKFDIIVCNPPYIKQTELGMLQKEVRREPTIALNGGADGLDFYRRIARSASDYLTQEGSLFLEIGFDQGQDVKGIFSSVDLFKVRGIRKDFSGIERVLWISLS